MKIYRIKSTNVVKKCQDERMGEKKYTVIYIAGFAHRF